MKIYKMKTFKHLITLLLVLLSITSYSKTNNPEAEQAIDQLEKAFKMLTIQHVEPILTDDFTINDYSPSFSRQMLAGLIIELPIKKIKKREVISDSGTETRIKCKMVIAKYLGIFSQRIELTLVDGDGKSYIKNLVLINQGPEGEGIGVEVDTGSEEGAPKKEIVLEELEVVETNGAATYYEDGLDEMAKEVHQVQTEGLQITEEILKEEPLFKLGYLLLKDSLTNMSIDEAVIPIPAAAESEEEKDLVLMMTNWVYFHEVTELHLVLGKGILDPNTRWFRDGLADYVAHTVAKQLNPEADSLVMATRVESYEPIKGKADLLNWIGTGSEKKQKGFEGGSGHYAAAMFFFIDLTEKYGEEVIPNLLERLLDHKKITSKVLIKELSEITKADIKEMIESY